MYEQTNLVELLTITMRFEIFFADAVEIRAVEVGSTEAIISIQ